MFNKFMIDSTRFGHPMAQVEGTAYIVPVQMLSGLDLRAGEVCLDAVGKVVAWRFQGEEWVHWVHGDAIGSLGLQLESESDYIGAYALIRYVLGQGWNTSIISHGISTDEGTYENLSDAIASLKGWDFSSYARSVQGYR